MRPGGFGLKRAWMSLKPILRMHSIAKLCKAVARISFSPIRRMFDITISMAQKVRLQRLAQQLTGTNVHGLAGLYVYFLLLATSWLREGGLAAWLIPSEFMDVNYGEAIKRYLTQDVTLLRLHRFDPADGQFDDAIVSSAVVIYRKQTPSASHAVEFTFGGALTVPAVSETVPISQLSPKSKWTGFPRQPHERAATESSGDQFTFKTLFRVQRDCDGV